MYRCRGIERIRIGLQQADVTGSRDDFGGRKHRVAIDRHAVVLMPYQGGWQTLFDSLDEFSEDFMASRGQSEQQLREDAFE